MAVIRNDPEALVATYDRVGRMALGDAAVPAIGLSLFWLNSIRFLDGELAESEGLSMSAVGLLAAVPATAILFVAVVSYRIRFHRWLRFAVTVRGLEWSSGRWRAMAPWREIRSVESADMGRTLRVYTMPSGIVRTPWWSQWAGKSRKDLPFADLGLDPFTLNAALIHFSTECFSTEYARRPG